MKTPLTNKQKIDAANALVSSANMLLRSINFKDDFNVCRKESSTILLESVNVALNEILENFKTKK